MLPFLKPKRSVTLIMAKKPEGMSDMHEEGEHPEALMSVAEDLISAIHSKDAKAVASALMAAQDVLDVDDSMEEMSDE